MDNVKDDRYYTKAAAVNNSLNTSVPNKTTRAAINEAERMKSGEIKAKEYTDLDSLMNDLLA